MLAFVLACLAFVVVLPIIVRAIDVVGLPRVRLAAMERRERWEARRAGVTAAVR